jgi:four helix bundle suffix protein
LLGVARASLQELLEDYEDFLRQNGFRQWEKESVQAKRVRALVYQPDWSYRSYLSYLSDPEQAANAMICLINQANFLLDRQLKVLKEKFLNEGGWTEQMFRERLRLRRRNQTNKSD